MQAGTPIGTAPDQRDLDHALAAASRALVRVRGERPRELARPELAALGAALRLAPGGAHPDYFDPPGSIEVLLDRDGTSLGTLLVHPDLAVRWSAWRAASDVADPAALGEVLAAHGVPGPLAALRRRTAPDAAAARAAFLAAAPAPLGPRLDALARDPWAHGFAAYRDAFEALSAAAGSPRDAAWAVAAWLGASRTPWGEGPDVERVADGLLRAFGVHEVIALAKEGAPAEARAGLARFLVENVQSRGWDLRERLPEDVRRSLVEAAGARGSAAGEARAAALLLDEQPLVPRGAALAGLSHGGALRRVCVDAAVAIAADGYDIVRLEGGRRAELTKLMKPDTPLALRDGEAWFLDPSGPRSIPIAGGAARKRSGPWFGLPARRLERELPRFYRGREEAIVLAVGAGSPRLALDVDRDERDAYEAFGGELPSALRSRFFWVCDVPDRALVRVSRSGEATRFPLDGEPFAIAGGADDVVLVAAGRASSGGAGAHDEVAVVRASGDSTAIVGRIAAQPDRVLSLLLGRDGTVWMRLRAPLGDLLVTLRSSP